MKEEEIKVQSEDVEELEEVAEVKEGIKRGKVIAGIIIAGFLVILGGVLGAKMWLGREEVITIGEAEGARYIGEEEGELMEEYCLNNFRAQELWFYTFREKTSEEIEEELGKLKEGFSEVSRKVGKLTLKAEFREVGEIIASDTAQFLTEIRSLRQIETKEGVSEADKQAEFIKVVEENKEKFRSAVYLSRYAFEGDEGELVTKSGLIARGRILVEVGGGVMNVFVGDYDTGAIGVSTEDYEGQVRALRGEHELLVMEAGEMVRVGTGVKDEMELGKGMMIDVKKNEGGAEVTKTKVGMIGRTVFEVDEIFTSRGVKGFVKNGEKTTGKEAMREVIEKMENNRG